MFVHAQHSQRMPTYGLYADNMLEVRWLYAQYTLLIRNAYVHIRRHMSVKARRL